MSVREIELLQTVLVNKDLEETRPNVLNLVVVKGNTWINLTDVEIAPASIAKDAI